jgi:hypothetical protein
VEDGVPGLLVVAGLRAERSIAGQQLGEDDTEGVYSGDRLDRRALQLLRRRVVGCQDATVPW